MNLLIVDDEESAIDAVSRIISSRDLGIDRLFTANSAQKAREYIQAYPIDILVCDIEMPKESGLQLLEWVNREKLGISCIYMTCFAEFSYAQRAINLGSMAYLLKPIRPKELTEALESAIQKRLREAKAHKVISENEEAMTQAFWRDLFHGETPSDRGSIARRLQTLPQQLDADWFYCPVLLAVRDWGGETDRGLMHFGLHNISEELFTGATENAASWRTVMFFGREAQLALCGGEDPEPLERACRGFARQYLDALNKYFSIKTVCYVGMARPVEDTAQEIEELFQLDGQFKQNHGLVLHRERLEEGASVPEAAPPDEAWDRSPVEATKRYIEGHLMDDLNMDAVAGNVHLNPDYLTRLFKQKTGLTVKNYMIERRLERARELLEQTDMPIAEVAYQCGYDNYASFNSIFHKRFGRAPKSYRRPRG